MPWKKFIYNYKGSSASFLDDVLADVTTYVTDQSIHGDDAWQLMRNESWPYGTVLKVPNYQENEYGYIGLMADKIRVGSSYWNWLKQDDVLRKEFALSKKGLGLADNTDFTINNGVVTLYSKNPYDVKVGIKKLPNGKEEEIYSKNYSFTARDSYTFSPTPDIFAKDANVLFFTMFKQYQPEFDWSELMGNERASIQAKALKYYNTYRGQTYPSFLDPPLYPGVGCPAIGYSPDYFDFSKNECSQDDKEKAITVYLYKDRHRLIIVINWQEHWDVASVGFFEAFDTQSEYPFPAMALGGTSGALPITELCSYNGTPQVEHGFRLDYTEKNWSLSHGIPTFASTWWNGSNTFLDSYMYSQVQAMLPNGNWQSFANFGLQQDAYYYHDRGQYYSAHKEPERISGARYYLTPNFTDLSTVKNIYPSGVANIAYLNDVATENCSTYQLEPLYFVANTAENTNQNLLGKIKNIYWSSQQVTRYGIHEKDGATYLVLPNGWVNRKFHIKNFFSVLQGESQSNERQIAEIERLDKLSRCMNCVIKLSE